MIDSVLKYSGVYQTTFPDGISLTWRLLTLKEYRAFSNLRDEQVVHPYILFENVFEYCYLGDANLLPADLPAGITISLGQFILWLSGDSQGTTLVNDIEAARANYNATSVVETMKRIIYIAFPSYLPEDVENWNYQELLDKFVLSEALLQNKVDGYQPMDLKKVTRPGQKKAAGIVNFNDLAKENRAIESAVRDGSQHSGDMHPAELERMRKRREMQEAYKKRFTSERR